MIVVGLTGNYGMGKSTVARMFKELGAVSIDTDAIVSELFHDLTVIHELKETFGEGIVESGSVDKQKLADIVFRNSSLRIALENIFHPRVFRRIDEELARLSPSPSTVVIIEAPVLFERGYQGKFDKIITVFTSEDAAIERLKGKGVPEEKAVERLKNQFPSEMKAGRSDFTIDNSKGVEDTVRQVEEIYRKLLSSEGGNRNN